MKFVMLIGISGSGKTTSFLNRMFNDFRDFIYLSSDDLRAVIGTAREDQSVNGYVFQTLKWQIEYFLRQGKDVVMDATNLNPKERRTILSAVEKAQTRHALFTNILSSRIEKIAFVKQVETEKALERNRTRGRNVPEDVIWKQVGKFVMPTLEEGFDVICVDSD